MISLNGRPLKAHIQTQLASRIADFIASGKEIPCLAIVQVGDNPRSNVYIDQKRKYAELIGAKVVLHKFPETISPEELHNQVKTIAEDVSVHGIIVQIPLPEHFSKDDVMSAINCIPASKDADGLTASNMGTLITNEKYAVWPATTRGIIEMIRNYKIETKGKYAVVVGRSNLVGKPTALALLSLGATVTICHSATENLAALTQASDIIVAATGKIGLIGKDHVKAGQTIIDVGISINEAGEIKGDVSADEVGSIVAALSPVPGGVGPLTVAGLFLNLLDLYERTK